MSLTPFTSVLVANRGEIALRIMRTVRAAGMRAIAVHTLADADAPHVTYADQAVCIGDGPVGDSYLSVDKIIAAARDTGAGAVHPGYGFLSESAAFAQACRDAGLVFVGPSSRAIELMGNKAAAKRLMIDAGVPCVPGYQGEDPSDDRMQSEADAIGYPVMIKAAAGGGGRGMRLVAEPGDFINALHLAQAEAQAAFGADEIILEKAVLRPRHVEIQVFADRAGNVVHLGERDCSVQRRHQKVVEESPCPVMTPELRAEMGAAAVQAARSIDYEGAGTVEFLLDDSGAFYFLEMNTRLQVEHPVTEMVTGRDLVALQLAVATGEPLGFDQSDVELTGHAIEVRLYAEDPANDFLPVTGNIAVWNAPGGPGIRVDEGIVAGTIVSPFYDPMLAKIIAYGPTRAAARTKLIKALQDTILFGVTTNRDFLIDVLQRDRFAKGAATTAFIAEEFGDETGTVQRLAFADIAVAAGLTYRALQARANSASLGTPTELLGWSSTGRLSARLTLVDGETSHLLQLCERNGVLTVSDGAHAADVSVTDTDIRVDGHRIDVRAHRYDGHMICVATGNKTYALENQRAVGAAAENQGRGTITAPMHGNLLALMVGQGDTVKPGTQLAVLEAMKMQHELLSQVHGTVRQVFATAGTQIKAGAVVLEIDEAKTPA